MTKWTSEASFLKAFAPTSLQKKGIGNQATREVGSAISEVMKIAESGLEAVADDRQARARSDMLKYCLETDAASYGFTF